MDINQIHNNPKLNKLIKEYHSFYKKFYNGGEEITHKRAVKNIDYISNFIQNKDLKILEYGCATGFNLRYLKSIGYKNLYGIDALHKFIKIAKSLNDDIDYTLANFADKSLLPVLKPKYDFIFTRSVLQQYKIGSPIENELDKSGDNCGVEHINNIVKAFHKSLNVDGLVVIVEGLDLYYEYNLIFESNGFQLTLQERHDSYGRFFYRKKKEI